jgi:Cu(I)/Ag(I) efflux system membrane fusion protein
VFEMLASPGLFVPHEAVIRTGEHDYVYVATSDERFEPRLVRTGVSSGGKVELLSGVSEGDRVVTRGSFMLDSESRLQASLAAAPGAASAPDASASAQSSAASSPSR